MKDRLLGDTIRQARMDNKMTQEQLAEAINISPTHMKHIESEHRKPSEQMHRRGAGRVPGCSAGADEAEEVKRKPHDISLECRGALRFGITNQQTIS